MKASNKGFVISILMIFFILSLIQLAQLYADKTDRLRGEVAGAQGALALGYADDDVMVDLSRILGANITLGRNSSNWTLTVRDSLANDYNRTTALNNYKSFLEGVHTNRSGVNYSINVGSLNDSLAEITFTNGLRYDYAYGNSSAFEARFYNASGNSGVREYWLDVATTVSRQSLSTFTDNPSGDIRVVINYTDGSGSTTQDVRLSSTTENWFNATLSGSATIAILVGKWNNQNGSLVVNETNGGLPRFNFTAIFPNVSSSEGISWSYDSQITVRVLNSSKVDKAGGQRV